MTVVTMRRAKAHLSQLLRRVAAGEEVVIARGRPVARLVPIDPKDPRRPGLAKGRLTEAFFDPLPADELAAWQQ